MLFWEVNWIFLKCYSHASRYFSFRTIMLTSKNKTLAYMISIETLHSFCCSIWWLYKLSSCSVIYLQGVSYRFGNWYVTLGGELNLMLLKVTLWGPSPSQISLPTSINNTFISIINMDVLNSCCCMISYFRSHLTVQFIWKETSLPYWFWKSQYHFWKLREVKRFWKSHFQVFSLPRLPCRLRKTILWLPLFAPLLNIFPILFPFLLSSL